MSEKEFVCFDNCNYFFSGCGKSFNKPSLLLAHSLVHTGMKPFPCQFEGKQYFLSRGDLIWEITLLLQPQKATIKLLISENILTYSCNTFSGCHWSFRTISKLRRHERTHNNDRKHVCLVCSKSYFRPGDLN
jgi:uncharacterized Zn-finger protein